MAIYAIKHITRYIYEKPVTESMNEIRVYPYLCAEQEVLNHELHISFNPLLHTYIDYWKNKVGTFSILHPHKELIIENNLLIRTTSPNLLLVNFHSTFLQLQQEMNGNLSLIELAKAEKIKKQTAIQTIIDQIYTDGQSVAEVIEKCSNFIFKHFKYVKGITDIETTVDEILNHKSGVCQDFAHVMLQILRSLNIPSRYVSGYICPNKVGMRGEGATHAWVEAYIPDFGWAGIDPTNNVWVTNYHVKLAIGRNFNDCSPVKGTFRGDSRQELFVQVSIQYEDGKSIAHTNTVKRKEYFPVDIDLHQSQLGNQQQ